MNYKHTLGAAIEKFTAKFSPKSAPKTNVAIIGVTFDSNSEKKENYAPNKIRAELYQLAQHTQDFNIVDLGNLIPATSPKGNFLALRDIVDYFGEIEVPLVIIGGSQDLSYGVCEAFKNETYFSFSTVDFKLDLKTSNETFSAQNYISKIVNSNPQIFQFNLLGYQSYYVPNEMLSKIKAVSRHVRLGILRDEITKIEPILRDTNFLSFDSGAICSTDFNNKNDGLPNGLRGDEACQIAKYAGLSENMNVFGYFNSPENNPVLTQLSAQIIWYYLEGIAYRQNENPGLSNEIITYHVTIDGIQEPLVFLKSPRTNRWWIKFHSGNKNPLIIACTQSDYECATNNEIPTLWLKYAQKIDELLK